MSRPLQDGYRKWLLEHEFSHAITLTFRDDVSEKYATQKFDEFVKRINKKVFTRHHDRDKPLSIIAFMEGGYGKRLHFHILLQPYDDKGRTESMGGLYKVIKNIWHKLTGSHEVCVAEISEANHAKTINYITKDASASTKDSRWLVNSFHAY